MSLEEVFLQMTADAEQQAEAGGGQDAADVAESDEKEAAADGRDL